MHEQIIARNIIQEAEKHGRVKSIVVEVGSLAHLSAPEMKQVLEDLTNWHISVEGKKAKVSCHECEYKGEPDILEHMHDHSVFKCKECGAMFPEVLGGGDIVLKEVSVNE